MAGFLALIPAISGLLSGAMDLFDGDKKRQAELILKQLEAEQAGQMAQTEINKTEAAHASLFVAGWRPFIGWVCGVGFLFEFFVRPMLIWATSIWCPGIPVPPSLSEVILELVFAMLGIGGLRTFEKVKGVARG